ncbi:MAG TPA: hypothetical protein VHZ98_06515 [Galbitalea sp.]|jgi:hypothetical protein|nr:hypothetical protein [Galbitalea sp.]
MLDLANVTVPTDVAPLPGAAATVLSAELFGESIADSLLATELAIVTPPVLAIGATEEPVT